MERSSSLLCPENEIELVMELVKGKEYANQLQAILSKIVLGDEEVALGEELAHKVLRSFTDTLARVSLCRTNKLGQIKTSVEKDFGESGKKRPAEMMKDKRGCYRRRKDVISWVIVSPTTEDGYAWRKYGQKAIQNSKHPRCYFRCTHKFDRDCKALKHVEKIEGDGLILYKTTYISQHTCKDQTRAQIIVDSEVTDSTSMIDFRVKMPTSNSLHHIPPTNNNFVPPIIIKQESNGDTKSDLTDNLSSIASSAIWPAVVGSEGYSPKMASIHDQEVASSLYAGDASTSLGDLDIKSLISDKFLDFPFEEL
ncbi:hypothetical protein Leryth_024007 [Lithospermum erythrorhizon]|nr:hypothetical protein Leryth_024007 [Lithospermum erythrorhizon]